MNWGYQLGGQPPHIQDERTRQCQASRITCWSPWEPPVSDDPGPTRTSPKGSPAMAHGPAAATTRDKPMVSQETEGLHGHTLARLPRGALLTEP